VGSCLESMNVQAKRQVGPLPMQVRVVLDAFLNGSLPAGQLSDALSRAWALEGPRIHETPRVAAHPTPRATTHAAAQ
jgi:hypothetical protein